MSVTLYRFYKKPDDNNEEEDNIQGLTLEDRYPLYALTNEKSIAKKFMHERNMKKFILRKDKISSKEYKEYANSDSNRRAVLTFHKLTTVMNKYEPDQVLKEVLVLMTENEYVYTTNCQFGIDDEGWWVDVISLINIEVLKPKIYKSLKALSFISFYQMYAGLDIDDEDAFTSMIHDELAIFVSLFGDTFK